MSVNRSQEGCGAAPGFSAKRFSAKECGASMIEVLVALLIASTVLLGITLMSLGGLSDTQGAYYRGQANLLAYDMADRIKANPTQRDTYDFKTSDALTPANADCTGDNGCSQMLLADLDKQEWAAKVAARLPAGLGEVVVNGEDLIVRLQWAELDWTNGDPTDGSGDGFRSTTNRSLAISLKVNP